MPTCNYDTSLLSQEKVDKNKEEAGISTCFIFS